MKLLREKVYIERYTRKEEFLRDLRGDPIVVNIVSKKISLAQLFEFYLSKNLVEIIAVGKLLTAAARERIISVEIRMLKTFVIKSKDGGLTLREKGEILFYSDVSSNFGPLTKAAIMRLQKEKQNV